MLLHWAWFLGDGGTLACMPDLRMACMLDLKMTCMLGFQTGMYAWLVELQMLTGMSA